MCSDCKNLNIKDKKAARVKGNLYYCKATKKYCYQDIKCELYKKDDKRKKDDIKKVAADLAICDNSTIASGIAIVLIFLILFIIAKCSS